MLALVAALLTFVIDTLADHPDLAKALLQELVDAVKSCNGKEPSREQLIAIESGLAARQANAVQEALRRERTKGHPVSKPLESLVIALTELENLIERNPSLARGVVNVAKEAVRAAGRSPFPLLQLPQVQKAITDAIERAKATK